MTRFSSLVLGLVALSGLSLVGGCAADGSFNPIAQVQSLGDSISDLTKDHNREASVEAAKANTSDPVGSAIVLQNKDMYEGSVYDGAYFSAKQVVARRKLVEERRETPVAKRAEINARIAKASDEILVNERTGFDSKIKEFETAAAQTTNESDKAEIQRQLAWFKARRADLNVIPANCQDDNFNIITMSLSKGANSVVAKQ